MTMQAHRIHLTYLAAMFAPIISACAPARFVEENACPQLTANADPRSLRFSASLGANASLQSFMTAARGIIEVSEQAESLTVAACRQIALDLGAAPNFVAVDRPESLRVICAEAAQRIKMSMPEGGLQMTLSGPICSPNERRRGQCEARCDLADESTCAALCETEARLFSNCRSAHVEIGSSDAPNIIALANTLSRNLPWLLHAYSALAQRLQTDATAIVSAGTELPRKLKSAEPNEVVCVGVSAAKVAMAGNRLRKALDAGGQVINLLGGAHPRLDTTKPQEAM